MRKSLVIVSTGASGNQLDLEDEYMMSSVLEITINLVNPRLQQLRCLWSCCYGFMKSDFFANVFNTRLFTRDVVSLSGLSSDMASLFLPEGNRLQTYFSTVAYLNHTGELSQSSRNHFLLDSSRFHQCRPNGRNSWWIHWSEIRMAGRSRSGFLLNVASPVNESKTVNLHPTVSLVNFLSSSGIRVMEDRIGTSRRLCTCSYYTSISIFVNRASTGNVLGPRINSEWTGPFRILMSSFYRRRCRDHALCGI